MMLNFRKLKQDFAPTTLKEGKSIFEKECVHSVKIDSINNQAISFNSCVAGHFDQSYRSKIEIDRQLSVIKDSSCSCSHKYDCQHLAAAIFYLEQHVDAILVDFSNEVNLNNSPIIDSKDKKTIQQAIKEAENKETIRKGKKFQKDLLQEYIKASQILAHSPFFLPEDNQVQDRAELLVIFNKISGKQSNDQALSQTSLAYFSGFEIQLALRLPYRSKPLVIPNIREFLDAVRYCEGIYLGTKRYFFTPHSFDELGSNILKTITDFARYYDSKEKDKENEVLQKSAYLDMEAFGLLLAEAHEYILAHLSGRPLIQEGEDAALTMPGLFSSNTDTPLRCSTISAGVRFEMEYLDIPAPKILLTPKVIVDRQNTLSLEGDKITLFECAKPGFIYESVYHRFNPQIKRKHLRHLPIIRNTTIPEPLFGTLVENTLPEIMRVAEVSNREVMEKFVTLPFTGNLGAICDINYLNGKLDASLSFTYDSITVPASTTQLEVEHATAFVTDQGILARDLTQEQNIINDLFQGFIYDPIEGFYSAKTDKKIVEFMTEVIPRNQARVKFNCPENLLDQFIYDNSTFKLQLSESSRIDMYEVQLKVEGHLNGTTVDLLWDCLRSKRSFIELDNKKINKKKGGNESSSLKGYKVLVLDLEKLAPVVQIFDEMGINMLDDHIEQRPLWSLACISEGQFANLPIEFSMTSKLVDIQQQMLGKKEVDSDTKIPDQVLATFRSYQLEGIHWLSRLRHMHLNGILADDMGLGKTLQAITAVTQEKLNNPKSISLVVCPTSLVYNWKEEFNKFNPKLTILPVDGSPAQRQKLFAEVKKFDVIITSYNLLQKDIDFYKTINFSYAILDEAQHIKNRMTRNAKSVKLVLAAHRLILTGTPIENSLEELWSLFDFLMPGLLSTYDRFVEKFIRPLHNLNQQNQQAQNQPGQQRGQLQKQLTQKQLKKDNAVAKSENNGAETEIAKPLDPLEHLKRKVSPFILRRMKKDVLSDLPSVSEIIYHCHLSDTQKELYRSYAKSAREELVQLVKKEGFDNVQIHVLATLTRLKQICCHPAIFAKEKAEAGDSAKYDMLLELVQSLIQGKHKAVIFSQYTRMLQIMRHDFEQLGMRIAYLDGSSKNRMDIVNNFNEDEQTTVFLVSLKAGGSGLNLVGADTVIHYDMWWNPAVENQATDRVHRIGQKSSVSSYKLITLGTIEEKILELQSRKRGLVKKVISTDEDAISKLTWEEVLELLDT